MISKDPDLYAAGYPILLRSSPRPAHDETPATRIILVDRHGSPGLRYATATQVLRQDGVWVTPGVHWYLFDRYDDAERDYDDRRAKLFR